MTFSATAGRIYVTAVGGATVFDTNERLFIATDALISGQIITPSRVASATISSRTDVNVDSDTVVASINASADAIFGAFKITVSGIDPMGAGGWFQATGSYLNAQFTMGSVGENHATEFDYISGAVVYTFRATGGQLIFNERVFMRSGIPAAGTNTLTMPACTVDFKLYVGSYV